MSVPTRCEGVVRAGPLGRGDVACGRNAHFMTPNGSSEIVLWRDANGRWLGPCCMPQVELGRWPDLDEYRLIGEWATPQEVAANESRDRQAMHALSEDGQGRTPGAFGHLVDQQERQWWDWRRFK
jgi:hypothetical protein